MSIKSLSIIPFIRSFVPKRGSFAANVLTLMSATTIAQVISIAVSPFLARIYSPKEYGIATMFGTIVSLIAIISTGRYEMAIMLPKKEDDAVNIVAICLIITLILSLITFLIILFFSNWIGRLLRMPEISVWLYFVPVSVLLTGLYQTLNFWSNRNKQYRTLGVSRIAGSASGTSSTLVLGLAGFGLSGLILGSLIGQVFSTAVLSWQVCRNDRDKRKLLAKTKILENVRKYRDFPKINSLHAFLDMVQVSGVVFVISTFFGPTALGLYSFSVRVLKIPLSLIGSSFSQVFYQKASDTYNSGDDLQLLIKKTIISLSIIALPALLIIMLLGPYLFSLIFGERWREAGIYSQLLSPWIVLNFIISPISQIPIIVSKQKESFLISLLGNSLLFLSILYGGYIVFDIKKGFLLLSILLSIYYVGVTFWFYKISSREDRCVPC